MTPQGQAGAPAPQGWFSKNWKWLVGLGCLGVVGCCGVGSIVTWMVAPEALEEAARQQQQQQQEQERARDDAPARGPVVKVTDADGARVDCGTPGPGGVDCELKRTSGEGAFKACWDLEITCTNGAKMVGQGCGTVGRGEAAGTANMPVAAFSNQDACDAPASGAVQNLVITTTD